MSSIPKTVRTLGWVSFWTDMASESVYPIIPLFLVRTLGAPVAALGAIEGIAQAIVSLMRAWSGWHSDRVGKRVPYIRWGYGLSAASKPLMGLAGNAWTILALRSADRVGKGIRTTARDALIADESPPEERGRIFGWHRMMDSAGAVAGTLAAGAFLYFLPGQYRIVFLAAAVPSLLAIGCTMLLKERPREPSASDEPPVLADRPKIQIPRGFWPAMLPLTLFALANSSDTLLLLRIRDLGFSDLGVIGAYALYNFGYSVLSSPLGRLSDRLGRRKLLAAGWLVYAATYFAFARTTGGAAVWLLMGMYGLYMAATDGVSKALVADLAPRESRGTVMGIYYGITGIATLLGSLSAGLLWDRVSPGAAFELGGVLAILALASLAFVPRATRA